MFKNISKLGISLNADQQKTIKGGLKLIEFPCGGDGSFIYQNDVKVCCYQPADGTYIC